MTGKVTLVGAGPGDPELLTMKAHRLIQAADVIVYDRLVSVEILKLARPAALLIDVGKSVNRHPVPQQRINEILVACGKAGYAVVRLKGGDPFLFGRGGEEMQALARAGLRCEVVPGITSAQGAAAEFQVPLTHRGLANGVRFVTGHMRENLGLDLDWHGLADRETTLVIYMGLSTIGEFARGLIARGREPSTPVLAVAKATCPEQRHLVAPLSQIEQAARDAGFASPVIFIVGEVAQFAAPSTRADIAHELQLDRLAI